jgi:hypothetical protein
MYDPMYLYTIPILQTIFFFAFEECDNNTIFIELPNLPHIKQSNEGSTKMIETKNFLSASTGSSPLHFHPQAVVVVQDAAVVVTRQSSVHPPFPFLSLYPLIAVVDGGVMGCGLLYCHIIRKPYNK